jgi:hypothetical protein
MIANLIQEYVRSKNKQKSKGLLKRKYNQIL